MIAPVVLEDALRQGELALDTANRTTLVYRGEKMEDNDKICMNYERCGIPLNDSPFG